MIDEILTSAGFIKDKTYIQTTFNKPPSDTFCVYLIDDDVSGSDEKAYTSKKSVTIELYAPNFADEDAEKSIEKVLKEHYADFIDGYECDGRQFLKNEQLYLTVYRFEYYEKIQ